MELSRISVSYREASDFQYVKVSNMEQFISGLVQKKLSQKMIKEMLHSKEIFLNATLLRFFFSIFLISDSLQKYLR